MRRISLRERGLVVRGQVAATKKRPHPQRLEHHPQRERATHPNYTGCMARKKAKRKSTPTSGGQNGTKSNASSSAKPLRAAITIARNRRATYDYDISAVFVHRILAVYSQLVAELPEEG